MKISKKKTVKHVQCNKVDCECHKEGKTEHIEQDKDGQVKLHILDKEGQVKQSRKAIKFECGDWIDCCCHQCLVVEIKKVKDQKKKGKKQKKKKDEKSDEEEEEDEDDQSAEDDEGPENKLKSLTESKLNFKGVMQKVGKQIMGVLTNPKFYGGLLGMVTLVGSSAAGSGITSSIKEL